MIPDRAPRTGLLSHCTGRQPAFVSGGRAAPGAACYAVLAGPADPPSPVGTGWRVHPWPSCRIGFAAFASGAVASSRTWMHSQMRLAPALAFLKLVTGFTPGRLFLPPPPLGVKHRQKSGIAKIRKEQAPYTCWSCPARSRPGTRAVLPCAKRPADFGGSPRMARCERNAFLSNGPPTRRQSSWREVADSRICLRFVGSPAGRKLPIFIDNGHASGPDGWWPCCARCPGTLNPQENRKTSPRPSQPSR